MGNAHDGHRERMRERLRREGLEGFAPHEVLEYILFITIPRGNTNPIAHALLKHFGSLAGVFDAPYEDLIEVEGVGPKTAELLCLVPAITRRYYADKNDVGLLLQSPDEWGDYIKHRLIGYTEEVVCLLCLDSRSKLLYFGIISRGSPDSVSINMRELVKIVTRIETTRAVLAHNHPSGFAQPSVADFKTTEEVQRVLLSIGVELLDHIIVAADNDYISLRDSSFFAMK